MVVIQFVLFFQLGLAIEQGKYEVTIHKSQLARIPKNLYKNSDFRLSINATCAGKDKENGSVSQLILP